ncbi:MAG: hypothetical protein VYC65_06835 [Chloroflexota bacterium]|nr:hypothetical protein [Chloroflexota bacterium]
MNLNIFTPIQLSIIVVTALTLLMMVDKVPTVYASEHHSVTIVEESVEIDYGNKISISITITSGIDSVDSVRALFKPRGDSTVWSYSYPKFSINKTEISLTVEIPTGPGSYYPPGTEFDLEIEIADAKGHISTARSNKSIQYLDPSKDWKDAKGDGFSILYYGIQPSRMENLITQVNRKIPLIKKVVGLSDAPQFTAIVFPSVREATPSFPPISHTASDQLFFAGFAQPKYGLFVQGQVSTTTFIHELAHLYVHEAVSSSLTARIPSWLDEGLAVFLETGKSQPSNERLRSSVRPDELLPLRNMNTVPGRRDDVSIFYPQAGAFVGYLIEEYGSDTMARYLTSINNGQSALKNFTEIYGQSIHEIENEWRRKFNATPLTIPATAAEPARTVKHPAQSTPVPLVNYTVSREKSSGSTSYTPKVSPTVSISKNNTNDVASTPGRHQLVPAITVALALIMALGLFVSRRNNYKRNF